MTPSIRIRTYNVRFGDAILVTIPDRDPRTRKTTPRFVLIDVGNVLGQAGGDDTVFEAVVADILKVLAGRPLDLYVMTHEHLDHVQGLFYAATKHYGADELKQRLNVQDAWLTASSAPDYYTTHPKAREQKLALNAAYTALATQVTGLSHLLQAMLANNNPRATEPCVQYLRDLAAPAHTHYVHRAFVTARKHPFREAKFSIWAPEEDTSDYFTRLLPIANTPSAAPDAPTTLLPPAGVDVGAFYDLLAQRANGNLDNLLAIDRAANNTSVVFAIEWRGRRLLFAGDAELGSWRMMRDKAVLVPVDFLKVSHHGSHNGTPANELLDRILPGNSQRRRAVISTWDDTYGGIPHGDTNDRLRERCRLQSILDDPDQLYFDVNITARTST
jgi:beta-lactamase superfamily II metal-dependent hydrolase